ncbi:hypothetical protein R1H25_17755 [Stenotrophomonas sp. C2852]|uniref:hypothetical protein n=1 Tax=Stenotrophomonas sp. C2852 TaxID=3077845 RepID=UPI00293C290A|nr:hypothetical protein [Stenotrophomonas sp. C2852]MDV3437308.1 hypothetical protein [Stenotrophomonas sp. C2852]
MQTQPDLLQQYRALLVEMTAIYRDFEGAMTKPQRRMAGRNGSVFRFPVQDAEHAIILKLAAMLNFLNGALQLCESGVVLAQGALERMADEAAEDVTFLAVGISHGMTQRHLDFLDYFWREDFTDFDDTMNSFQSRPQVPRDKIAAAIHAVGNDPSTGSKVSKIITKSYSGFVHAAAPHVMELYDVPAGKFRVESSPAYRKLEHQQDLWNYMYRGAMAIMAAAKAFGSDAHFQQMGASLEEFQDQTQRNGGFRRKRVAE